HRSIVLAVPRMGGSRTGGTESPAIDVLRIYHSAVVGAWRQRDRELRQRGISVTLVSARRWDEGGHVVALDPGPDTFVVPAATFGRRPNAFLYDPRPVWKVLRSRRFDVI